MRQQSSSLFLLLPKLVKWGCRIQEAAEAATVVSQADALHEVVFGATSHPEQGLYTTTPWPNRQGEKQLQRQDLIVGHPSVLCCGTYSQSTTWWGWW